MISLVKDLCTDILLTFAIQVLEIATYNSGTILDHYQRKKEGLFSESKLRSKNRVTASSISNS